MAIVFEHNATKLACPGPNRVTLIKTFFFYYTRFNDDYNTCTTITDETKPFSVHLLHDNNG